MSPLVVPDPQVGWTPLAPNGGRYRNPFYSHRTAAAESSSLLLVGCVIGSRFCVVNVLTS